MGRSEDSFIVEPMPWMCPHCKHTNKINEHRCMLCHAHQDYQDVRVTMMDIGLDGTTKDTTNIKGRRKSPDKG
jgi:hypothetical protein